MAGHTLCQVFTADLNDASLAAKTRSDRERIARLRELGFGRGGSLSGVTGLRPCFGGTMSPEQPRIE